MTEEPWHLRPPRLRPGVAPHRAATSRRCRGKAVHLLPGRGRVPYGGGRSMPHRPDDGLRHGTARGLSIPHAAHRLTRGDRDRADASLMRSANSAGCAPKCAREALQLTVPPAPRTARDVTHGSRHRAPRHARERARVSIAGRDAFGSRPIAPPYIVSCKRSAPAAHRGATQHGGLTIPGTWRERALRPEPMGSGGLEGDRPAPPCSSWHHAVADRHTALTLCHRRRGRARTRPAQGGACGR